MDHLGGRIAETTGKRQGIQRNNRTQQYGEELSIAALTPVLDHR
jgi:hypothetical protein